MNFNEFYAIPGEKPLDRLVSDGGFCGIMRTIACIGDSLASGEFESLDEEGKKGYHDYYEYSWGQYLARMAGTQVYNFSRGGMTTKDYMEKFAESRGFWDPALAAQGYIIALGVNDILNNRTADEIINDIEKTVRILKQNGKTVIIQSVPPFDYKDEKKEIWLKINNHIKNNISKIV